MNLKSTHIGKYIILEPPAEIEIAGRKKSEG